MNEPLTFLSWNLCMMKTSAQAPMHWRMDLTENEIREVVLRESPDFVCFQELPGLVPFVEGYDLLPANTRSHSGDIATIVRKDWIDKIEVDVINRFAVFAIIPSENLTLVNVHLAPGNNGKFKRLDMLQQIEQKCKTDGLLIVGDTNSRLSEEKLIAEVGLQGTKPPRATWDTRANRFRDQGHEFTAYFTRYFHNQQVVVQDVEVWDEPIEHEGKKFFVSDHFALTGSFHLAQSDEGDLEGEDDRADESDDPEVE